MNKIEALLQKLCPNGVEFRALGELGKFISGLRGKTKNDFKNGNARYVSYLNVFNNLAVDLNANDFVKITDKENQNTLQLGDVIFTGSSETPLECGMSSVVTINPNEKIYLNSFCFGFRFDDKNLFLPDFCKYLFRDDKIRRQIVKCVNGVTRFNISKRDFINLQIPIPPIEIQKEIVKILDTFTELEKELEKRRLQYEHYRERLLSFEYLEERARILASFGKINPHEVPPNLAPLRGAEKEEKGGSSASALLELEAEISEALPLKAKKRSFLARRGSGEEGAALFAKKSDYVDENISAESRRSERVENAENTESAESLKDTSDFVDSQNSKKDDAKNQNGGGQFVKMMKLGEVCKCFAGGTPKTDISSYWDNGTISWMSSGEVNKGTIYETEKKITQLGYDKSSTKMIPPNSVVLALAGQGKTRGSVARIKIPLCTNQSLCAIVPNKYLNYSFLYFYLKNQYKELRQVSAGDGTRGGLNLKMVQNFQIPIPPLAVQNEVVEILDRFDSLVNDISSGIPAQIRGRKMQYEYYREKLLTFKAL